MFSKVAKILASSLIAITVISGFALGQLASAIGAINTEDITNQLGERPTKIPGPEIGAPINILLIGSDTRKGQGGGYGGNSQFSQQLSDTNILVHIAGNREWATAVSIPRDTAIQMPDCQKSDGSTSRGYYGRFNEAYGRGGAGCVVKTLEQETGIFIDHFMIVDFKGFINVVDAVGGVEVCLTSAVNDKKSKLNLPKGISTVSGKQALAFVRARGTLGDGSDLSRIRRQQDFLASLVKKVTSAGTLLNPVKVLNIVEAVAGSLTTNPELGSLDGMKRLAFNLQNLKPSTVRFITAPFALDPTNQARVIFTSKTEELWTALREDNQWPKPPTADWNGDPLTVDPSNVYVSVLNATTTSGLASKKANELSSNGFRIVKTDNAPQDLGKASAVWSTKKSVNKARTLAVALGLNEVKLLPKKLKVPSGIVVIVGEDWPDSYKNLIIKKKVDSSLYGPSEGRTADETDCSPA
ncbi:MAG: LCP family protein [Candidatus Nanopelagicales bacterium]